MTKVVAFDTETGGLDWWDPEQQAFLASWADEGGAYVADLSVPEERERFISALVEADVLVGHNLPFDIHQVRATLGYDCLANGHELHCTDMLSRVIHPEGQRKGSRGGHGLKNLSDKYCNGDSKAAEAVLKDLAKTCGYRTLKTQGAYYDVWRAYPDQMNRYAAADAQDTRDLFNIFRHEIDGPDVGIYRMEQAVMPILINAEAKGVALDQEVVTRLHAEYSAACEQEYQYLVNELGEEAMGASEYDPDEDDPEWIDDGYEEKVNKTEALRQALLNIGVPLYRTTKTGLLATNKFALQEFEDEHPQIAHLFEWRRLTKFLSTYLEPMLDREVVHTSFSQIAAWTGRMSSRRPNMQNIPKRAGKEIRAMFVPRPGYSFIVFDYDSIEARLLAYYLGPRGRSYADMIAEGFDVHAWMATHVYGGAIEHYFKGAEGEGERDEAKNTTYAICYGAGGRRITDMNKLDPGPYKNPWTGEVSKTPDPERGIVEPQYAAGKAMASKIKNTIPGFQHLNARIKSKIKRVGYVRTLMGRRNPVNKDKSYVGLNALIQGSAADVMKQGVLNVQKVVEPLGGYTLLVVHDEIVVEIPTEHADAAAPQVKAALEAAADIYPPLVASGGVVHTNYADA